MKVRNIFRSFPLPIFIIFLSLAGAISYLGYRHYHQQKDKIIGAKFQELSAIAGLKTEEIANWQEGHLANAKSLRSNRNFTRQVAVFLRNPQDRAVREDLREWLSSFQDSYGYRSVALLDENSGQLLLAGDQDMPAEKSSRELALAAMRSGEIQFSGLHASEVNHLSHLDILVPLLPSKEKGHVPAALMLVIDPATRLTPLIRSWPTQSPTAETLLVRKQGQLVVFLNELRHHKGTANSLRFPLSSKNLPAAMALRGFEGTTWGVDYRGVPVLAALKKVRGAPWFLVAKVDADEVLKPVRNRAIETGVVATFLILLAGLGLGLYWRHGRSKLYKRMYEEEYRYHLLAERLESLTRYAYDAILLFNGELRVIEANEKALDVYGYSRDELLELRLQDLLSPDEVAGIEERSREIRQGGGAAFESVHRRKDGSLFPVECSVGYLEMEGAVYSQVIVRDASEKKVAELRIERLNRMYYTLSQANQAIVHGPDRDTIFAKICRIIVEQGGLSMAWIGLVDLPSLRLKPVASFGCGQDYLARMEISLENTHVGSDPCGRAVRDGCPVVCADLASEPAVEPWRELAVSQGYLAAAAFPLKMHGQAIGLLSGYSPIPEYFNDEIVALIDELTSDVSYALESLERAEELRRSEERYRLLFDHMTNGFVTHELVCNDEGRPVDYRILDANPSFEKLTGIPRHQAIGGLASQVYGCDPAPFLDIYAEVAQTGTSAFFDTGSPVLGSYFSISAFSPASGQFATIFSDITAIKIAEEERNRNEARLESLYNISQYRATGVQDLLDFYLAEALRLTASKFGYIYFYNEEKREFTLNSWSNDVMKECAILDPQTKYALENTGLWGEAVRQRRPILVNDFQGCTPLRKGYPAGHVELFSYLTIPVFAGEKIVAVIGVANKGGAYDETDIRQLTLLSDSVWKYVERKNIEEELISLNLLLEQRVQERTADLESFTYSVSHDLRAPLRAIIGFSRIVSDDYAAVLGSEGQRLLDIIIKNTQRMGQLIDDLLDFSRAGRAVLHRSQINMAALAKEVLEHLLTDDVREKIAIRLDTLPTAVGDASLLRQVWTNLLSNAVKFSLPRGNCLIEVGSYPADNEDVYFVKDHGVGFDMHYADKLFGIFQRLHSISEFEGNGVGLAIVQRIVTCHGGRVWAESRQGEGATFYFSLPRNGGRL